VKDSWMMIGLGGDFFEKTSLKRLIDVVRLF
jgi:hypothetical protein